MWSILYFSLVFLDKNHKYLQLIAHHRGIRWLSASFVLTNQGLSHFLWVFVNYSISEPTSNWAKVGFNNFTFQTKWSSLHNFIRMTWWSVTPHPYAEMASLSSEHPICTVFGLNSLNVLWYLVWLAKSIETEADAERLKCTSAISHAKIFLLEFRWFIPQKMSLPRDKIASLWLQ